MSRGLRFPWFRWFRRADRDDRREAWRHRWAQAVDARDRAAMVELRHELDELARAQPNDAADEPWDMEHEMLEGLEALVMLAAAVREDGLPIVATGHRAAGADRCHFTAKVSLPDDPAHPSGTLLITNARLVFVGGSRGVSVSWAAISRCVRQDRDLLLPRTDGQAIYRIRCNTFTDALQAAFLAAQLAPRPRV